jgi:hypothetical protein
MHTDSTFITQIITLNVDTSRMHDLVDRLVLHSPVASRAFVAGPLAHRAGAESAYPCICTETGYSIYIQNKYTKNNSTRYTYPTDFACNQHMRSPCACGEHVGSLLGFCINGRSVARGAHAVRMRCVRDVSASAGSAMCHTDTEIHHMSTHIETYTSIRRTLDTTQDIVCCVLYGCISMPCSLSAPRHSRCVRHVCGALCGPCLDDRATVLSFTGGRALLSWAPAQYIHITRETSTHISDSCFNLLSTALLQDNWSGETARSNSIPDVLDIFPPLLFPSAARTVLVCYGFRSHFCADNHANGSAYVRAAPLMIHMVIHMYTVTQIVTRPSVQSHVP